MQYFYVRSIKYRDFFLEIIPSQLKVKDVCAKPLLQLGPEGQLIIVSRRDWWPSLETLKSEGLTLHHIFQKILVIVEQVWKIPEANINGFEVIMDCSQVTFSDVRWASDIRFIVQFINLFHKAFPLRAKKIHLVNPSKYLNIFFTLIKTADPANLMKKLESHHGNLKSLHEQFSPDILPDFFGGKLSEEEAFNNEFHEKVIHNDEQFLKLHKAITKKSHQKRV
jgi:hypothetical protein